MSTPDPYLHNIIADNPAIGNMAAEHLLERGFCHFGYCGFDNMYWSCVRGKSFSSRISQAGFETHFYKRPKSRDALTWYKEEAILAEWLRQLPKPVGIMACNDDRGQHVTEACALAKLSVPYEVAIIGVDNDDQVCDISNPPLSSIELDVENAGFEACKLLDKMISGKKLKPQTFIVRPTRVVTRQSTNIVAIDDVLVSQALNFIEQNAKNPIQVSDVVKALNVSRTVLTDKFMRTLRRSIYSEIKRVRTNAIAHLLLETDLSISDIAFTLGFNKVNHIARYFKQTTGLSPLEYRKLRKHK
jgi:LacI family transcriptional regulator